MKIRLLFGALSALETQGIASSKSIYGIDPGNRNSKRRRTRARIEGEKGRPGEKLAKKISKGCLTKRHYSSSGE